MINIVINNYEYHPPTSCEALSIRQFQSIVEWGNTLENIDKLPLQQVDKSTTLFLSTICGVDIKTARKTKISERISFIKSYIPYVNDVLSNWKPEHNRTKRIPGREVNKYFTWQGNRMLLPKENTNFYGQKMPMANISAIELCEATDLYICDAVKYAPLIVAILCRKEGEVYNEAIAAERAKSMYETPLSTLWELYAQLNETHKYLRELYPYCYTKAIDRPLKQQAEFTSKQVVATWNDLIIITADHRPSEIEITENLNAYNFMRIANSKLRTL